MNLETAVTIPSAGARERAAEYRRAARRATDADDREEMTRLARFYDLAVSDDLTLIALTPTIRAGGTMQRTRVHGKGHAWERREQYALPRIAVCRADSRFCFCLGVEEDGAVRFIDQLRPHWRYSRGRVETEAGALTLPTGFVPGHQIREYDGGAWATLVPIVPPRHRPRRGGLAQYLVLWEVEDWRWHTETARAPRDPALLRHVAGDIYAVLGTWDLSDLERIVLGGRQA